MGVIGPPITSLTQHSRRFSVSRLFVNVLISFFQFSLTLSLIKRLLIIIEFMIKRRPPWVPFLKLYIASYHSNSWPATYCKRCYPYYLDIPMKSPIVVVLADNWDSRHKSNMNDSKFSRIPCSFDASIYK